MNEPNGTLVMTTCKCRENTKNLVMTRTYFTEMLENKIAQGVEKEQQRIIQLLEKMDIEIHYTTLQVVILTGICKSSNIIFSLGLDHNLSYF